MNQFARAAVQQEEQLLNDSVAGFTWKILLAAVRDSTTGSKNTTQELKGIQEVEMIVIESINNIGLTVSNLEKSIEFYKDLFDFEVVEKLSNAGQAFIKMGDMVIALNEVEGYNCPEDAGYAISFYVDEEDFEDALDELEELEITIVFGPENIRNGQSVVFLDPDGNKIELSYPKIS
ncbi:MAG: hypothetical protein CVV44_13185 [Spirochaetae bacterium HGW-Spirochaetae-1]|nr:MAG: hypothetical protein CVV44_13185 [Spirochaetae bacterium HGW-Spirochaetae-1]